MLDNDQLYVNTTDRAKFFQTVQAWPLSDELNYIGWLNNFEEGEERNIACMILNFFTHYSKRMVNQMLKSSVANSGHYFVKHFEDWKHTDFKTRCIYSFIPGESPNPTDSGNLFTRKLRDELGISETQIIDYSKVPYRLSQLDTPTPIVFVDDFVGTGNQVRKAWIENPFLGNDTLKDYCIRNKHCAVYAPLIVNSLGYKVIKEQCIGLNLSATHILGPEYCLFNQECICWNNDLTLFRKGVSLILAKSRELGIPSTNGRDVRDEKGFGMQGLAISFEHGAPDAIPSFFYWSSASWTPLISKTYKR